MMHFPRVLAFCGACCLSFWLWLPTSCVAPTPQESGPEPGKEQPRPDAQGRDAPPATSLKAAAKVPAYAQVQQQVTLDASASQGAVRYRWSFGNGEAWEQPRPVATASVTYAKAGRYQVVLEIFDAQGNKDQTSFSLAVVHPANFAPKESSTIVRIDGKEGEQIAVVSPDSHELTVLQRKDQSFSVLRRYKTLKNPRTVAVYGDWLLVACQDDDALQAFALAGDQSHTLRFDYGARPYGVVVHKEKAFVTLQAKGQVAEIDLGSDGSLSLAKTHAALQDVRGIARLPDGRLLLTRWRSPADKAELLALDPTTGKTEPWSLQFDPQPPSDTEIGGVPSYLNQILVSPTGREIAIPSLQANIRDGTASSRSGIPLQEDTSLRAIISFIGLPSGKESFSRRLQLDNRGFLSGGAFSSRGDYLFVTARGSQLVERIDMLRGVASGTIFDVGHTPEGVALSKDDRFLYVNAYLSRQVVIFDVRDFDKAPEPVARVPIVEKEPLSAQLLRGKKLFNDSSDPRIAKEGYIACAHCHLEGDSDHLVWDFTQRGEGLRNTISLLGRKGAGDGPIHWSGNFDEIHDFEHDIRGAFGGKGLMTDAQFNQGTRSQTLGDKKAGLSPDLDALSAYVSSLASHRKSPFRTKDGKLTPSAARGKQLFESTALGCQQCHKGPRLTDSRFLEPTKPQLHDVGTLKKTSGKRLNGTLTGIDTPTLHGLWDSAPYLHDGSAKTLKDVLVTQNPADKHGKTSQLTTSQLNDLIAYLNSLDGKTE